MKSHEFILNWIEKARLYDSLTEPEAHFPGNMKKVMLENASSGSKIFRDITSSEYIEIAKGRQALDFEGYVAIAQKMALSYQSSQTVVRQRRMRFPVKVHKHMLDTQEESSGEELDEMGRMMTSMKVNQVTRRRRPGRVFRKQTRKYGTRSLTREKQE